MSCEVIDDKWTLLIKAYLPPSTLEDLPYLAKALTHFWEQNTILLGDLSVNIQAQNPCSQQVADLLMEFGLVEL